MFTRNLDTDIHDSWMVRTTLMSTCGWTDAHHMTFVQNFLPQKETKD